MLKGFLTLLAGLLIGIGFAQVFKIDVLQHNKEPVAGIVHEKANTNATTQHSVKQSRSKETLNEKDSSSTNKPSSVDADANQEGVFTREYALFKQLSSANKDELLQLIEEFSKLKDSEQRTLSLSVLFKRLVELDPNLASDTVTVEPFVLDSELIRVVWGAWAKADLVSALNKASTLQNPALTRTIAGILYSTQGPDDLSATKAIQEKLGVLPSSRDFTDAILTIARTSMDAAIAKLNQITPLALQAGLAKRLGAFAANTQPETGLIHSNNIIATHPRNQYEIGFKSQSAKTNPAQYLQNWLNSGTPDDINISSALTTLALEDFSQAEAIWLSLRGKEKQTYYLSSLLAALAEQDMSQALHWAKTHETKGRIDFSLRSVSLTDPEGFFEALSAMPPSDFREKVLKTNIGSLANEDINLALSAIDQLSNKHDREEALGRTLNVWLKNEPSSAVNYMLQNVDELGEKTFHYLHTGVNNIDTLSMTKLAEAMVAEENYSVFMMHLASRFYDNNSPREAVNLIKGYKDSIIYNDLSREIASGLAMTNPKSALDFIDGLEPGIAKDKSIQSIAYRLSKTSAPKVAELLESITSTKIANRVAWGVGSGWGDSDPKKARDWIEKLDEGATRDSAIEGYLSKNGKKGDLNDALDLARTIDDPKKKTRLSLDVIYNMAKSDSRAALRAADKQDLNQSQIDQLEQFIDKCQEAGNRSALCSTDGIEYAGA